MQPQSLKEKWCATNYYDNSVYLYTFSCGTALAQNHYPLGFL